MFPYLCDLLRSTKIRDWSSMWMTCKTFIWHKLSYKQQGRHVVFQGHHLRKWKAHGNFCGFFWFGFVFLFFLMPLFDQVKIAVHLILKERDLSSVYFRSSKKLVHRQYVIITWTYKWRNAVTLGPIQRIPFFCWNLLHHTSSQNRFVSAIFLTIV